MVDENPLKMWGSYVGATLWFILVLLTDVKHFSLIIAVTFIGFLTGWCVHIVIKRIKDEISGGD